MPTHRVIVEDTPNARRIREQRDLSAATNVLLHAASEMASDIGRELITDLLNGNDKSEPYDADRIFRIAVLDEGFLPSTANTIYLAALLMLEHRGIL